MMVVVVVVVVVMMMKKKKQDIPLRLQWTSDCMESHSIKIFQLYLYSKNGLSDMFPELLHLMFRSIKLLRKEFCSFPDPHKTSVRPLVQTLKVLSISDQLPVILFYKPT
jgi:hypothetical protein